MKQKVILISPKEFCFKRNVRFKKKKKSIDLLRLWRWGIRKNRYISRSDVGSGELMEE